MTAQDESNSWSYEDEIDLRRYLEILFKWWREILFLAILLPLLTALGLLAWDAFGTPTYRATSSVLVARSTRNAVINEQFETVLIDEYSAELTNAMVGLVYSGSIAQAVIGELGELLDEDELIPSKLLQNVEAISANALPNMRGESDLIVIAAESDAPHKAAAIANSWANHYISQIYVIYGQVPDELNDSMQAELAKSEITYTQAQSDFTSFLANSPMLMLERKITGTLGIANSLIAEQNNVIEQRFAEPSGEQVSTAPLFDADQAQQNTLDQVDGQLRLLQSQLESERATYRVLSEKRNIAWEAWKTLQGNINEMNVAQLSTRGQVRLASAAVAPADPVEVIGLGAALPLAVLIGMLFGVVVAFLSEFVGKEPFWVR